MNSQHDEAKNHDAESAATVLVVFMYRYIPLKGTTISNTTANAG